MTFLEDIRFEPVGPLKRPTTMDPMGVENQGYLVIFDNYRIPVQNFIQKHEGGCKVLPYHRMCNLGLECDHRSVLPPLLDAYFEITSEDGGLQIVHVSEGFIFLFDRHSWAILQRDPKVFHECSRCPRCGFLRQTSHRVFEGWGQLVKEIYSINRLSRNYAERCWQHEIILPSEKEAMRRECKVI